MLWIYIYIFFNFEFNFLILFFRLMSVDTKIEKLLRKPLWSIHHNNSYI